MYVTFLLPAQIRSKNEIMRCARPRKSPHVRVDVVRAARLRRLVDHANAGRETPMPLIPGAGGDNS